MWGILELTCWTDGYKIKLVPLSSVKNLILAKTIQSIVLAPSPWFGYGTNYSSAMGGIERNSSGHIVSAQTAQLYWSIRSG